MDLRTYQERAKKTDRNPGTDEQARMIPLAGLASETGELLGEYKKYLRDGESHKLFKERLAEEVGDLLWYVANVATKFGLDLAQVAEQNLAKCEGRWGGLPDREPFDAGFPDGERFPRQFSIDFLTYHDEDDTPKVRVMYKGKQFGDDLTDNAHVKDGYGYHDVIHLAFAAVLGWSPLVRKMLKVKRKSDPKVDQVEDGGRAIATEEGLSAMIFAYARDYNFFEGKSSVSTGAAADDQEHGAAPGGVGLHAGRVGARDHRGVPGVAGGEEAAGRDRGRGPRQAVHLAPGHLNGGTMRIIGHGIDVVKIAEIKAEVDSTNKRWAEQFCSADERERAGTTPARYRYYASCFAAKEAVVKALGTGFAGRHHLARHRDPAAGERSAVRPAPRRGAGAGDRHGDNRLVHQHQLPRRGGDGERDRGRRIGPVQY